MARARPKFAVLTMLGVGVATLLTPQGAAAAPPPATAPVQTSTAAPTSRPTEPRATVAAAVRKGVDYLLKSQNKDGSWGTGKETRGFEVMASVPGSLKSFQVATTALCVMALREAGQAERQDPARDKVLAAAHDQGLEFLVTHADIRRDDGALLYNTWAHTYAIQCLAIEMRERPDPRIKRAAQEHVRRLTGYETVVGGWNYYDFNAQTQTPSMGPTSFGSAATLVAMFEARQSGLDVPQPLLDRTLKRLAEMKLPNQAYLYSFDLKYMPRLPANQPRGSVGRTQACNFALWVWEKAGIDDKAAQTGLDFFLKEHDYIQMGRKRQYPHESWYQTAPYYYYFGHYYAARLIEKLGPGARTVYGSKIADMGILPYQDADGSWWDFAMWDFHKPYGTAFAVMTLLRCE
jgi:hypothetical protein